MNPSRLFVLRPVATTLSMLAIVLAGWYFLASRSSQVISLVTGQEETAIVDFPASKASVDSLIGVFKVNYFENKLGFIVGNPKRMLSFVATNKR